MLGQLTDTLTTLITNLYVSTGLLGIVLAMAIESCCIPLPSEIVMPLAGIMIGQGKILQGSNTILSIVLVAFAGALGCLIGSVAAYYIGYIGGRPLMLKYGRYVLISQHDADKADMFFQRWGSATAFFSRLLPVVRTYISLPAGISKMPIVKFAIYTFLGSFPWCLLLAYAGLVLNGQLDRLSPIFHTFDVFIVLALVILVGLYVWRHVRNDRKARETHQAAVAENGAPQGAAPQPTWSSPNQQVQQPWSAQPMQQYNPQGQPHRQFQPPRPEGETSFPQGQPWPPQTR